MFSLKDDILCVDSMWLCFIQGQIYGALCKQDIIAFKGPTKSDGL